MSKKDQEIANKMKEEVNQNIPTPEVDSNEGFNFEDIDADIEFYPVKEAVFIGKLLKKEERETTSGVIEHYLLGEDSSGKKWNIGGASIIKFFDNFYTKNRVCRIEFDGQARTNNGRTVNKFKFAMAK